MSRILKLTPPYEGLEAIVNVEQKVGPKEVNVSDDVRVVQQLLQLCAKASPAGSGVGFPAVTGHFDSATGFWIYYTQHKHHSKNPHQVIDGVVSPAHGSTYFPGSPWTIVVFNEFAKASDPMGYNEFVAEWMDD